MLSDTIRGIFFLGCSLVCCLYQISLSRCVRSSVICRAVRLCCASQQWGCSSGQRGWKGEVGMEGSGDAGQGCGWHCCVAAGCGVGWTSAGPPSSVLSYQPSTSACPILLLSFDSKVHHVFLSAK